jgi:hypothetical protein
MAEIWISMTFNWLNFCHGIVFPIKPTHEVIVVDFRKRREITRYAA